MRDTIVPALLALGLFVSGCTAGRDAGAAGPSASDPLVGTWQWKALATGPDGLRTPAPRVFMRYYPDGRVATWPTPYGEDPSWTRYEVQGDRLTFGVRPREKDSVKKSVPFAVDGDELRYAAGDHDDPAADDWAFYERVRPDLRPGSVPAEPATRPALGFRLVDLNYYDEPERTAMLRARGGNLVVDGVTPGSRAERLGLREGDAVTTVAGQPLRTLQDVIRLVGGPGPLRLDVVRDGRAMTLDEAEADAVRRKDHGVR